MTKADVDIGSDLGQAPKHGRGFNHVNGISTLSSWLYLDLF